MTAGTKLEILLDISEAIVHLHAHGIVHGDVACRNVLLNDDNQRKVVEYPHPQCSITLWHWYLISLTTMFVLLQLRPGDSFQCGQGRRAWKSKYRSADLVVRTATFDSA